MKSGADIRICTSLIAAMQVRPSTFVQSCCRLHRHRCGGLNRAHRQHVTQQPDQEPGHAIRKQERADLFDAVLDFSGLALRPKPLRVTFGPRLRHITELRRANISPPSQTTLIERAPSIRCGRRAGRD